MSFQVYSSSGQGQNTSPDLENCLSGYHRICLDPPYRLDTVSPDLCRLLGYSEEELRLRCGEDYSLLVCPRDQERFLAFLDRLAQGEQSLTLRYAMVRQDGTLLSVCDAATSRRLEDGKLYAFSVVSDVSHWPEARGVGDLVSGMMPYGFLQCTCEDPPRITYLNQALIQKLSAGEPSDHWTNAVEKGVDVFLLIPMEERDRFHLCLGLAQQSDWPIQIDHHACRTDGTRIHLTGWLSRAPGDDGQEEFSLLYTQMEDGDPTGAPVQGTAYFPVLKRSYNAIFQLDLDTNMVECIHGLEKSPIGSLLGIKMTLPSAAQICLNNYVCAEDRDMMMAYLTRINGPESEWEGRSALQVEFRLRQGGELSHVLAVAVHLDESHVLLCCRDVTQLTYSSAREKELNTLHALYRWMDFLSGAKEGNIGMLMLEKTPEGCSLLYGTSSVLRYLGLDTEDTAHRSTPPSLAECLEAADMTQEDFDELASGKSMYLWSRISPDLFQFQLTCKTYTHGDRTLYVLWCSHEGSETEANSTRNRVFARTFGHFDLFVDNVPITFSSVKEKELMALLIDRNGGSLSPAEAVNFLWEDEAADKQRASARYRKLAMGLKRTLEKYGIEDIVLNHNGIRSVDTSAIRCDYYEYLAGNEKYRQAFHNAYMSDYSWGEETLSSLWNHPNDP
jgi:PAS domain S-box-containing protein